MLVMVHFTQMHPVAAIYYTKDKCNTRANAAISRLIYIFYIISNGGETNSLLPLLFMYAITYFNNKCTVSYNAFQILLTFRHHSSRLASSK